ncbi:MAG TPA: response regulator [Thermoanaerobaculia bacterium]|nr:response regulator [Thermoanaerobaculia bacterium]
MLTAVPSILIVEDDPAIRAMLLSALRREPLHVESAVDGVDALQQMKDHHFAVVIVDLMMPRMDGFAFVEELRQLRRGVRPIVFVMTAYDDAMLHRLEPGTVHAYLRKPFDVALLVEMVRDCAEAVTGADEMYVPPEMMIREDNVC